LTPFKYSYIGYAVINGTDLQIAGLGIGTSGNPQQGLNVTLGVSIGNEIKYFSTITNSSGMFALKVEGALAPNVTLQFSEANGKKGEIILINPNQDSIPLIQAAWNTTFEYASPYTLCSSYNTPSFANYELPSQISGIPVTYYPNGTLKVFVASTVSGKLYYNVTASSPNNAGTSGSAQSLQESKYAGYLTHGTHVILLDVGKLENFPPTLYELKLNLTSSNHQNSVEIPFNTESRAFSLSSQGIIDQLSAGTFATFFPIIFLYLGYGLLAKPKDQGALDFLLSRPVTRGSVFVSRYLGGVMTAIVSSALFVLSLSIPTIALLGVPVPALDALLLFMGLTSSLTAFYSIMVMIASLTKSSGKYLGIALFTFFFFLFIETLIATILLLKGINFVSYLPYLNYNLPLDTVTNAISSSSGTSQFYANVPLEIVGSILWIAVPTMIAYLAFTEYFKWRKLVSSSR
jgi:ABC-type transport system involved in multi-copper enzyme maturation permease subunit